MFLDLVKARESCRHFTGKEVEHEKLINCIEAVHLAPSACNSQPWSFVVVEDKEKREAVAKAVQRAGLNKFAENAGAFIVICQEKANFTAKIGSLISETAFQDIDIGIAATHICYQAISEGVSSCILGMFDAKKIISELGLNKNTKIKLVIALGYPEKEELREKKRKPIEDIAKFI